MGDGKLTLNFRHKNTNSIGKDGILSEKSFQEFTKSPVIEYLKQVHKDHLLPHFLPFKKLAEAEQDFGAEVDTGEASAGFNVSYAITTGLAWRGYQPRGRPPCTRPF